MTRVELLLLLLGGVATAAAILVAPEGTPRARRRCRSRCSPRSPPSPRSRSPGPSSPSDAWLEANRLFAYAAAFAAAVALARVAPQRWPSRHRRRRCSRATAVCGYALLTKLFPEWLNEFELFARLREPFGYWNAVGLMGALAVPGCLWLGARREGEPLLNALAFPALGVCLSATLMAYSRGALLAAAVGAALWFVARPAAAARRDRPARRRARARR